MPEIVMEVVVSEGNTELRNRETATIEGVVKREVAIADGVNDVEVVLAIDISQLEFILISADQDLTMETNSSSAPTQTFTLVANRPFVWRKNSGITNPFSADVTKVFFSNSAGGLATGTVKIWLAEDATP